MGGIAQDLEHTTVEPRQLVEEEDTPVRKRNLARTGIAAAPTRATLEVEWCGERNGRSRHGSTLK